MKEKDSVVFSSLGYKDRRLFKRALVQRLQGDGVVELAPKAVRTNSVTVRGYERTDVQIGREVSNNMGQIGFELDEVRTGFQMGSVIKVRRPFTELETFGLYVTRGSKGNDSVLFRLNLYDINEEADTVTEKVDSLINDFLDQVPRTYGRRPRKDRCFQVSPSGA
ncbi:MAG: hypothetical protein ABEH38_09660 [Flavobacteriales bacterium]